MDSKKSRGIGHILLAALFFAFMTFFVRISGDLPSMQKAFFRNFVAMLVAIGILLRTPEKFKIKKSSWPGLLMRSACGCAGLICNFWAIDRLRIADANMLNKLSPFFAIIFSYWVLKEKANWKEWLAVIVAFIGALFVMKPSVSMEFIPALVGALGGLGAGVAYTFVRLLGKQGERGPVIVFFFSTFSSLCILPFFIAGFTPMTGKQWLYLILSGVCAMGGQLNITAAYTYAPAKEISVFDYAQILFAALLGFIFFDEVPDVYSLIGYVLIIGAAFYRWAMGRKEQTNGT
ncbi:MAG: DMT family transporter [Lachnospiraceae bacterium]|nr:DMT family transporter [Lachnospiraceae bacterium]